MTGWIQSLIVYIFASVIPRVQGWQCAKGTAHMRFQEERGQGKSKAGKQTAGNDDANRMATVKEEIKQGEGWKTSKTE